MSLYNKKISEILSIIEGAAKQKNYSPKIKIPSGYDKRSLQTVINLIPIVGLNNACKAHDMNPTLFGHAVKVRMPDSWKLIKATGKTKPCQYCKNLFVFSSTTQQFCSNKCRYDFKTDKDYFGGKKLKTYGLSDRTCQVCGRKDASGLTPHHVLGKNNDPKDKYLLAICRGCHGLITDLGRRNFLLEKEKIELLIKLAIIRKLADDSVKMLLNDSVSIDLAIEIED